VGLPGEKGPFRVRHQSQMAAVGRAEAGQPAGGTVGIKGVGLGRLALVVDIDHGGHLLGPNPLPDALVREVEKAFAMIDMDAEHQILHALEHDRLARQDLDRGPAGLEAAAEVVDKTRLVRRLNPVPGHPAEQAKQLATVTDA